MLAVSNEQKGRAADLLPSYYRLIILALRSAKDAFSVG